MKGAELVVQVTCLRCHHKSILTNQELAGFGIKPEAPIASFVKRPRCRKCRSGSVIANRIAANETATQDCASREGKRQPKPAIISRGKTSVPGMTAPRPKAPGSS